MDLYKVQITNEAVSDLIQIYTYISKELNAPDIAIKQVDDIKKSIQSLDIFPFKNKIVPFEPWRTKQYRQQIINNFIIYYAVDKKIKIVTILRIFYKKRNIELLIK